MCIAVTNRAFHLSRNRRIAMQFADNVFTTISKDISQFTGRPFVGVSQSGGSAGGGGASVGVIADPQTKESYFYKTTGLFGYEMLKAEFIGIKTIFETHTIRVPQPISYGTSEYNAYVIFEKLSLGGSGSQKIYGEKLAAMHRCTSPNGCYGFHINNTIGATFQPNNWNKDWSDFYDKERLGHMFSLCRKDGLIFPHEKELRQKVHQLLQEHSQSSNLQPCLVHGDLWSGNQAFTKEGDACIYDPATYYGDREVDIAMTKLFGRNSNEFYQAYDSSWLRPKGWEIRETIYNLYHVLNHYVLFGGSYANQAGRMMDQILAYQK